MDVHEQNKEFQKELDALTADAVARLEQLYEEVRKRFTALAGAALQTGSQERFKRLAAQAENALKSFSEQVKLLSAGTQGAAAGLGLSHAAQLLASAKIGAKDLWTMNTAKGDFSVTSSFEDNFLAARESAFRQFAGFVQSPAYQDLFEALAQAAVPGDPSDQLTAGLQEWAKEITRSTLGAGIQGGLNPIETARILRSKVNIPRVRAEAIARTETLRAYRASTSAVYRENSDVVLGWIWTARLDPLRTCPVCWAMHGTVHKLDEDFGSHVNCRCTQIPWLGGKIPMSSGDTEFQKLSDADQLKVLGPAKYKAYKAQNWKNNYKTLKYLVGFGHHPKWGPVRWEKSAKAFAAQEKTAVGAMGVKQSAIGLPTAGKNKADFKNAQTKATVTKAVQYVQAPQPAAPPPPPTFRPAFPPGHKLNIVELSDLVGNLDDGSIDADDLKGLTYKQLKKLEAHAQNNAAGTWQSSQAEVLTKIDKAIVAGVNYGWFDPATGSTIGQPDPVPRMNLVKPDGMTDAEATIYVLQAQIGGDAANGYKDYLAGLSPNQLLTIRHAAYALGVLDVGAAAWALANELRAKGYAGRDYNLLEGAEPGKLTPKLSQTLDNMLAKGQNGLIPIYGTHELIQKVNELKAAGKTAEAAVLQKIVDKKKAPYLKAQTAFTTGIPLYGDASNKVDVGSYIVGAAGSGQPDAAKLAELAKILTPKKPKAPKPAPAPAATAQATATTATPSGTINVKAKTAWSDLTPADPAVLAADNPHAPGSPWGPTVPGEKNSYGIVLMDDDGNILMREVAGHYDGYVWTFAKGKQESGHSPLETALKEVGEELGVFDVDIIDYLPGKAEGGSGNTYFYIGRLKKGAKLGKHDNETAQVKWMTPDEAVDGIKQTTKKKGVERDLKTLQASMDKYADLIGIQKTWKVPADAVSTSAAVAGSGSSWSSSSSQTYTPSAPVTPPPPPKPKKTRLPDKQPVLPNEPSFKKTKYAIKFPASLKDFTFVKALGGTTGAELVKDANGKLYVRKEGKNPAHVREEFHADEIYRAFGVDVPEGKLYEEGGKTVKITEFIEGDLLSTKSGKDKEAAFKKLQDAFAVDVLLGNWDVVGTGFDNILVGKDGKVWRIDNGSSMRFRAQGSQDKIFNEFATELWSMRGTEVLPTDRAGQYTKQVYGKMDFYKVAKQVNDMLTPARLKDILEILPPNMHEVMERRFDFLKQIASYGPDYQAGEYKADFADKVAQKVAILKTEFFEERLPQKFTRQGDQVYDENGVKFDGHRKSGGLDSYIASFLQKQGGDWKVIEGWCGSQAGSAWGESVQAFKYWIVSQMGADPGKFFWGSSHPNDPSHAKGYLDKRLQKYGADKYENSWIAWRAVMGEYLRNVDFPGNDRTKKEVYAIRTEPRQVITKHIAVGQEGTMPRGASESFSLFSRVSVHQTEDTENYAPFASVNGIYFFTRTANSPSYQGMFLGDGEKEIGITWPPGRKFRYAGAGKAKKAK